MAKVEGVDYSAEGIESIRQMLIGFRDESINQWPEAVEVTLVLSHSIALLAKMAEDARVK